MEVNIFLEIIYILIVATIFFLPTIVAIKKNHPQKIGIILVNTLGSLVAGLGWVAALIWSFILPKEKT